MVHCITRDSNKHHVSAHFVWPIFIAGSQVSPSAYRKLPTFFHICQTVQDVLKAAERASLVGLGGIILYELLPEKSINASSSLSADSPLIHTLQAINHAFPELVTIVDLCVCQYTHDSHCRIQNDEQQTIQHLYQQATLLLEAGAKGLMPSGMIPLFSKKLRIWSNTQGLSIPFILSQTAKFHSPLFAPFRSSEGMNTGVDKSEYQLRPEQHELALSFIEAELDLGADCALVKPGITYMEILHQARAAQPKQKLGSFITSGEHEIMYSLASSASKADPLYFLKSSTEYLLNSEIDVIVSYCADRIVESLSR